jgi:hypothetical protein
MNTDYPRKVNYSEYEHSFSEDLLKKFVEGGRKLREFDTEMVRGLIYGYTFTEDYAKGIIPDTLSMDYWLEKDENFFKPERLRELSLNEVIGHSGLIQDAIESTGDGTIDHPYCVICVTQEYEILKRLCPVMKILRQSLLPGYIDCIECEEYGVPHVIYFDISRWFEKVEQGHRDNS